MKKWKRGCLAVLAAAFFILSLGGCGIKDGIMTQVHSVFGLGKNQMFRIGNQVCQKAEAEIFLSSQKAAYESAYGASILPLWACLPHPHHCCIMIKTPISVIRSAQR